MKLKIKDYYLFGNLTTINYNTNKGFNLVYNFTYKKEFFSGNDINKFLDNDIDLSDFINNENKNLVIVV